MSTVIHSLINEHLTNTPVREALEGLLDGVQIQTSAFVPEDTVMTIPRRETLNFTTHELPSTFFVNPTTLNQLQSLGNRSNLIVEDEINEDGDALERLK